MSWWETGLGALILMGLMALTFWILHRLQRRDWCAHCKYSGWIEHPHSEDLLLLCQHSANKGTQVPPNNRPDMCPLNWGVEHKK